MHYYDSEEGEAHRLHLEKLLAQGDARFFFFLFPIIIIIIIITHTHTHTHARALSL